MKTFKECMEELEHYTAPPKDGDYDQHTQNGMKAMYDLVKADEKVVKKRIGERYILRGGI